MIQYTNDINTIYELLKDSKVVLFGTGKEGESIFYTLQKQGIIPAYFVDNKNDDSNNIIGGIQVYKPEVLLSENKRNLKIIVTSNLPYRHKIELQLINMALDDCIFCITINFSLLLSGKMLIINGNFSFSELKRKHYENIKYLFDRRDLLTLLPKFSNCAEIGVAEGEFSKEIMEIVNPEKLHLIDMWCGDYYSEQMMQLVMKSLYVYRKEGSVEINRGNSVEILKSFDDGYFDWVYIDTNHGYEVTKHELEACKNKVKKDGIIAGHDFCFYSIFSGNKYGVIEAVFEFCENENWEIIYVTEDIWYPSFALKRIR